MDKRYIDFWISYSTNGIGDTNINIHGDGVLVGHRENTTFGNQYAVNFTRVTNSSIDVNIDDFRTFEARLYKCSVDLKNRRFTLMSRQEETLWDHTDGTQDMARNMGYQYVCVGNWDHPKCWSDTYEIAATTGYPNANWSISYDGQMVLDTTIARPFATPALKISLKKGVSLLQIFNKYWSNPIAHGGLGGVVRDLRYKVFSTWIKFDESLVTTQPGSA